MTVYTKILTPSNDSVSPSLAPTKKYLGVTLLIVIATYVASNFELPVWITIVLGLACLVWALVNCLWMLYGRLFNKQKLTRQFLMSVAVILFIFFVHKVDYVITYSVTRIMESYWLKNAETISLVHSNQGAPFRYFRLPLGKILSNHRNIVYDESDQETLAPTLRTTTWWSASMEYKEGTQDCDHGGSLLHNHFYLVYITTSCI